MSNPTEELTQGRTPTQNVEMRRGANVDDPQDPQYSDGDLQQDPTFIGLRKRLKVIIEDLEEIYLAGLSANEDNSKVHIFKGMYRSAQSLFDRFTTLYEELSDTACLSEPEETDRQLRALAKRYYYGACSQAEIISADESILRRSIESTASTAPSASRPRTKLPAIKLPEYDGQITSWQRFKETFESLVINDPDLLPIDRFHYLVTSLRDSALAVIADIPITDANFSVAWKSLLDSYDNPRLIATAYLDQLLSLPPLTTKPSNERLKQMTNAVVEHISAFNQIRFDNKEDFLLFYLARRCFDRLTRESFELLHDQDKFPTYSQFIKFLRNRTTANELATGITTPTTVGQVKYSQQVHTPNKLTKLNMEGKGRSVITLASSASKASSGPSYWHHNAPYKRTAKPKPSSSVLPSCPACSEFHPPIRCRRFANIGVKERQACITKWEGCRNCLYSSHPTSKCPSPVRCYFCRGRHNSLLHSDYISEDHVKPGSSQSTNAFTPRQDEKGRPGLVHPSSTIANDASSKKTSFQRYPNKRSPTHSLSATAVQQAQILLGTAICGIFDVHGQRHNLRLAIDSGSQFSFLTRRIALKLGLFVKECNINILGIGRTPFEGFRGKVECHLASRHEPIQISTQALVVDEITSDLPSSPITESSRQPYEAYDLADPDFWDPRPIDFLLGSDLFADILTGEIITVAPGQPKLIGTIFGFVIMGRMTDLTQVKEVQALCATARTSSDRLPYQDLKRLWDLEEPPATEITNPLDAECEEHFRRTHYRLPSGRYVVRLPFKGSIPQFPSTRWMAIKRLSSIEGRLQRDAGFKRMYKEFMDEYLRLGHMSLAKEPALYIVPHHGVVKQDGFIKKLRVVFDASANTAIGSLNSHLHSGPKLQNSIVDIILNFRMHKFCFTADLVKMFRQVLLDPQDRIFQHILWRDNPADAVKEYELCTVTYGQAPASYLAQRVIKQLPLGL